MAETKKTETVFLSCDANGLVTDLDLEEYDFEPSVDWEIIDLSEDVLNTIPVDVDRNNRKDLTHLSSYAIDSADTTEVDDAISWEEEECIIWVHVADPTRYFPRGYCSSLLRYFIDRASTVYFPMGKVEMFYARLVEELLSLDGKQFDGTALSFGFKIGENDRAGELVRESCKVITSRISQPVRLTYERANDILQCKSDDSKMSKDLKKLFEFSKMSRKNRIDCGAVTFGSFDSEIRVNGTEGCYFVTLGKCSSDTPAQQLVEEMMIRANQTAATFGRTLDLALIYQMQDKNSKEVLEEMKLIPEGPANKMYYLRNVCRTTKEVFPRSHASLGVSEYAQVTSPIRRAFDIVNHLQLKNALRVYKSMNERNGVSHSEEGRIFCLSHTEVGNLIRKLSRRCRDLKRITEDNEWLWREQFLNNRQKKELLTTGDDAVYKGTICHMEAQEETWRLFHIWSKESCFSSVVLFGQSVSQYRHEYNIWVIHLDDLGFEVNVLLREQYRPGMKVEVVILRVDRDENICAGFVRNKMHDRLAQKTIHSNYIW